MNIGVFGPFLLRKDEAQARQAQIIAKEIGATIVTYHHVTDKQVQMESVEVLPYTPGFFSKLKLAKFFRKHSKQFDRIICPGGIDNSLFSILPSQKVIPLLGKRLTIESEKSKKAFVHYSSQFPKILVQSKILEQELISMGVEKDKIYFYYPLSEDFVVSRKIPKEFNLLFASSPRGPIDEAHDRFEAKGVNLLIESARKLPITLTLLWRKDYYDYLKRLISNKSKKCKVQVINKHVEDVTQVFKLASAVVIPYTTLIQSPEYPLSAIQALSAGLPVVCTTVPEMYELIIEKKCGVAAVPVEEELAEAILELKKHHNKYRKECRKVFEEHFLITERKINRLKEVICS